MRRVLVTGASGFVGGRLLDALRQRCEAAGSRHGHESPGLDAVDVTDERQLRGWFDERQPDAVVHCAALANPDSCEQAPGVARRLNAEAPGLLARLCAERSIRLIHFSTDLVFDGRRGRYSEEDAPAPLNLYGRTKLEGERAVLEALPAAAVVRVALVYGRGAGRPSFLDWLLAELAAGGRARLFTDQWRTPTPVSQLPEVVWRLLEKPSLGGLFHWAGAERVSRLEFGRRVCGIFGLPHELLEPAKMQDIPQAAVRPIDCSLEVGKLARALGLAPLSLEAGLRAERYP